MESLRLFPSLAVFLGWTGLEAEVKLSANRLDNLVARKRTITWKDWKLRLLYVLWEYQTNFLFKKATVQRHLRNRDLVLISPHLVHSPKATDSLKGRLLFIDREMNMLQMCRVNLYNISTLRRLLPTGRELGSSDAASRVEHILVLNKWFSSWAPQETETMSQ